MSYRYDRRSSSGTNSEDAPLSRLFIVNSKTLTEQDFREAFQGFGKIEELWLVKDRATGESKGVTYIKYSKTSEAAIALETMNGRIIGSGNRSLKIMIAASKEQGSAKDENEEERAQRLFVVVPKSMTDTELYDSFKQFGDIEYANIIRNRTTGESKGVAYVKFHKFSHAAKAYEECDRKFKAVFAEPRKPNVSSKEDDRFQFDNLSASKSLLSSSFDHSISNNFGNTSTDQGDGYTMLSVITNPSVNQDQLWRLFDIVPGMDYCDLKVDQRSNRGLASVVYTEHKWAAHAKEKLHGFEYPPGNRLIVKPDYTKSSLSVAGRTMPEKRKADLLHLAETIAQASSLIQAAGFTPAELLRGSKSNRSNDEVAISSVSLPDTCSLVPMDSEVAARCFIICSPHPPSNAVLKNIFCRFGALIDVYMLNNKHCGYAKYASRESAEEAIRTVNGAEINGIRFKVIEAEEPSESRKRVKIDDIY